MAKKMGREEEVELCIGGIGGERRSRRRRKKNVTT
jgi:hypothetical protein